MLLMNMTRLFPREHGLTVTWGTVLLLSLVLPGKATIAGSVLFLCALPSISLYDPFLSMLRVWKLGKRSAFSLLSSGLSLWQKLVVFLFSAVVAVEIWLGYLPILGFLFPVVAGIGYLLLFMLLPERNLASRSASVIFVTSQLVLLGSSFYGVVLISLVQAFVFISVVNVIIVVSVGQIVNSRIEKEGFNDRRFRIGMLLMLGSALVLFISTGTLSVEYFVLLAIAIFAELSYFPARKLSMKKVGIISSLWSIVTVLAVVILHLGWLLI